MINVPTDKVELLDFTNRMIETCRVSVNVRSAYCRLMNAIAETGRYDGTKSLINLLYRHLTRTAAHLFSPVELKFAVDFERPTTKRFLEMGQAVGRTLTRAWERNNTDILFGRGVYESLKYGACILKQWPQAEGPDLHPVYYARLVMPWQFGVYDESENDISKQSALCESIQMTKPEVWRRIYHLPNAKKLYERICQHAQKGNATNDPQSFFHQILSTSQLNTGVQQNTRPLPGGIVQLNNDPNYAIMGPSIAADTVLAHELWVQDETGDYTTILMVEPDIIVAPLYKKDNLLIRGSGLQPYRLIQANEVTNWFWGRSELVDLIEPQSLLSMWLDDLKRLFGLQVDKILGFTGEAGVTDEIYAQFRGAGYLNLPQGADIKDVTPKIPPETLSLIKFLIETINTLGEFPNIMQGQGEQGVRSMAHASTLLKTASPTLRDRALLVERQCAVAADLMLSIMEAKDPDFYWTKGNDIKEIEDSKFILADLTEDWRVTVDSHSSSPIFSDENAQLIMLAFKSGIVDAEYVIDNMPFPNKEYAKVSAVERQKRQQMLMMELQKTNPEAFAKLLSHGGGKH
jgi:hypothetical protein